MDGMDFEGSARMPGMGGRMPPRLDMMPPRPPMGGARRAKRGRAKKMAKGGSTASKRADGCATKGKTKGRFV